MLCKIAVMINFIHKPRCNADLIAVGAVALRRRCSKFSLGKLAADGAFNRGKRVCAARHAHCMIDIAPPRKGISYRAADAGCRTAEGFDLRRVVVRFVFKQQQPRLLNAVGIDLYLHGAGIDFVRLVKIAQFAAFFKCLCRNAGNIHEAYGLFVPDAFAKSKVIFEFAPNAFILEFNIRQMRVEGCMAAMIRPICVDNAEFGQRRLTIFCFKIDFKALRIRLIHCKPVKRDKLLCGGVKQLYARRLSRLVAAHCKRVTAFKRGFARIHGVDNVCLYPVQFFGCETARKHVYGCRTHCRPFALRNKAYALRCGIRPLVKLPRQIFNRKNFCTRRIAADFRTEFSFRIGSVNLRFGKNGFDAGVERRFVHTLRVIPVDDANPFKSADPEKFANILRKPFRRFRKFGAFFAVNSVNHSVVSR